MNSGAAALVRSFVLGYVDGKLSAYLNWPLVAALPPNLPFETTGLITSNQPWSGAYTVGRSLWATSGNRTPFHIEGIDAPAPGAPGAAKETLSSPLVVQFQLRPDPLAD